MKKNLFYLFALICSMSLFTACSDDNGGDTPPIVDDTISGAYMGSMDVYYENPEVEIASDLRQRITITKSSDTALGLELKDFSIVVAGTEIPVGDLAVDNCPVTLANGVYSFTGSTNKELIVGNCDITLEGTIQNSNIDITIHVSVGGGAMQVRVEYTGSKLTGSESSDASIKSFAFDVETYDFVCAQPAINEEAGIINFRVTDGTAAEDMVAMVPVIELTSAKATISPDPSVAQDFSNGKVVVYTVTAEDGTTKEYAVSTYAFQLVTDFETWVPGNVVGAGQENLAFYEVPGWTSSNVGAMMLKSMSMVDSYAVTKTDDAHSGTGAASIVTLDSKGMNLGFIAVPKVTPGSLFTGTFVTEISNTLNSTKFGVPFSQKPVSLKGWYKYTAGEDYYVCDEPYASNCDKAYIDDSMSDECSIKAVLYATNGYADDWSDCLTGVAGENNIYTSNRVVAIASLEAGDTPDWTEFIIDFDYGDNTYDPSQKYRLAIVCSSSKYGDRFWGAPGSTLKVDDFELVVE